MMVNNLSPETAGKSPAGSLTSILSGGQPYDDREQNDDENHRENANHHRDGKLGRKRIGVNRRP